MLKLILLIIVVSFLTNLIMIALLTKKLEKHIDPTIKNIEGLIDARISFWNSHRNK